MSIHTSRLSAKFWVFEWILYCCCVAKDRTRVCRIVSAFAHVVWVGDRRVATSSSSAVTHLTALVSLRGGLPLFLAYPTRLTPLCHPHVLQMIEPELAFADLSDDMACATAYLKYIVRQAGAVRGQDLGVCLRRLKMALGCVEGECDECDE